MAEVTGLGAVFIWEQLPLAIGRQYEQIFYAKHEVPFEAAVGKDLDAPSRPQGLKQVI